MLRYSTTGRYREGFRIFFLARPAAWPCPASDRPRCASTVHFPRPSVSAVGPDRPPGRCTSSSTGKTSVLTLRLGESARRSVSPVPPASKWPQSARQRISSSSRQILLFRPRFCRKLTFLLDQKIEVPSVI